jgi:hypothetical protein
MFTRKDANVLKRLFHLSVIRQKIKKKEIILQQKG